MRDFELYQLRYFIAVAEELHFGRAAKRLHISQPPLSQQIAHLETSLGVQLFNRNRRKVEITAAGRQFLTDARFILQEAQRARTNAQAARAGQIGLLRIGMNYTSAFNPTLSSILGKFHKHHPQVKMELIENNHLEQLNDLYNHDLDICFLWPTRDDLMEDVTKDISFYPIDNTDLQMVMRHDHPLARKAKIAASDLEDFPIYLSTRQTRSHFYDALQTACRRAGFKPDIHSDIAQLPFILSAVLVSSAISFAPHFLTRICTRETLFRPCDFLSQKQRRLLPLSLAYRTKDPSPLVQSFVKSVIQNN